MTPIFHFAALHIKSEPAFQAVAVLLVAGGAAAILWGGFRNRWQNTGATLHLRLASLLASFLGLALLGLAVWDLVSRQPTAASAYHLAVVIDTSDSVSRDSELMTKQLGRVKALLHQTVSNLDGARMTSTRCSLITFGENAVLQQENFPADQLLDQFGRIRLDRSGKHATDLQAAFDLAAKTIRRGSGAGAVVLVSDANETRGDALAAAQRLAAQGIPIHVLPVEGPGPAVWITDAFLYRRLRAGELGNVRLLFRNGTTASVPVEVNFERSPSKSPDGFEKPTPLPCELPPATAGSTKWPVFFTEKGLQFVTVNLKTPGRNPHTRQLYTYVERPPRLLSVGGDRRWEAALDLRAWDLVSITSAELTAKLIDPDYDAIVISALTARQIGAANLQTLATLVQERGVGLFIWNGDHGGQSPETPAVLTTYRDTPLEPLLPVRVDLRDFTPPIPPQQIIIALDTSGSMKEDNKIQTAQSICKQIVTQLRPEDTLDFITFTTTYAHLVNGLPMDEKGKTEAFRKIDTVQADGGTAPSSMLAFLKQRTLTRAGLFFITDGEFDVNQLSELSRFASTNAIALLNKNEASVLARPPGQLLPRLNPRSPLWKLGTPQAIPPDFDVRRLKFKFFEPEKRDKFFETGTYEPIQLPGVSTRPPHLSLPPIKLAGNAICYRKPGATVIGVRPKISDPILAFGRAGAGQIGVFTTAPTSVWLTDREAREAIGRWLKFLVPLSEPDRYDFVIEDFGLAMEITVTILAQNGQIPRVANLSGTLVGPEGLSVEIVFHPDPDNPGSFRGSVPVPRTRQAQRTTLILSEEGLDAVARPQRIPLMVPANSATSDRVSEEAWTQGINNDLIEKLVAAGGGRVLDVSGENLVPSSTPPRNLEHWPILATVAAIFYLLGIVLQRWKI